MAWILAGAINAAGAVGYAILASADPSVKAPRRAQGGVQESMQGGVQVDLKGGMQGVMGGLHTVQGGGEEGGGEEEEERLIPSR
jgi:hypothetical protein